LWEMGYYDFMARMGVPYFHFGGLRATDRLAELCGIGSRSEVLAIGCGTGYTTCYLAERLGCRVVGIDISEYFRVLRPGGYAGINELYKAAEMPDDTRALIEEAEKGFARAVGLEFYLPTSAEYEGWFREAGFGDVLLEQVDYDYSYWEYVEAVGG
jgi:ubiquinone/menaquinone biosynthesis C-methylase UbiE